MILLPGVVLFTVWLQVVMGLEKKEIFSQIVKSGKTKVSCTFTMTMTFSPTSVDMSKSKAFCKPKNKKIKKITQTLTSPLGYDFLVTMRINQPNTKLFSAKVTKVPEEETSTAPPQTTTAAPTTAATEEPVKAGTNPPSLPGEWVVIQHRGQYGNSPDYFAKTMAEYVAGFEDNGEMWLGLEKMSKMTGEGTWELEVEVVDWAGGRKGAHYKQFTVGPGPRYELTATSYDYSSTLRDGLKYHNGSAFSTIDMDQDASTDLNCAEKYGGGGWWYRSCYQVNLNGQNRDGGRGGSRAARWFHSRAKESTMKMRKISN